MVTQEDNRVMIPAVVKMGLMAYAAAERKRMDNPVIKEMITWRSLANNILRNEVEKRGFYKGK